MRVWLTAFLGLILATPVFSAVEQTEPDSESFARRGRISAIQGELVIRSAMSDEDRTAQINSTLQEGDLLSTSSGTFAEIEFPDATFLRMAGGTRAIIETVSPRILIAVETGSVYLSRGETPS